jgi:hypothetical protein
VADDDEPRPGEGGLTRWSRLKRAAAAEQKSKSETQMAARTPASPPVARENGEADRSKAEEDVIKDLPSIESLGKDSDYSLFMREGVPEETRTAALRKLWRSDPTFTEPFPFEMHMEDYNKTFVPINAATDTLYRAGLGYLFDDDKDKAATGEAAASASPDESPVSARKEIASEPREDTPGEATDAVEKQTAEEQISIPGEKGRR